MCRRRLGFRRIGQSHENNPIRKITDLTSLLDSERLTNLLGFYICLSLPIFWNGKGIFASDFVLSISRDKA
jgi:hypothetical protein